MSTEDGPFDILGSKVLLGVQVVDLSRLSTHPIPMIGRGLITVAGQGPTDSNGAGKSSWIAALSLLHADDQWRLTSGAPGAAELLFTAEAAGQEGNWSNVDRGYIVGVFSDPDLTDLDEIESSAVTVWIRINRKASYIPGPQLQRLTPAARRRLQDQLILAAAPASPIAEAIRARNGIPAADPVVVGDET